MSRGDNNIYDKLSLVYTHLMRNIRYDLWAEYLHNISKKYITRDAKVLELASGNGLLTRYFIKYYPDVISSDISISMIKSMKGRHKRVACDMTLLPFRGNFDLVFAAFDSVNYLLSEARLTRLFREVENILKPTGIFLFDISLEKNSFKHSKIPYSSGIYKGTAYVNKSEYDQDKRVHTNFFEITSKNVTYKEVHKQKIFPFETYFKILERTCLYPAECYEAFTFKEGDSDCDRVQFVIKKKNK